MSSIRKTTHVMDHWNSGFELGVACLVVCSVGGGGEGFL